MVRMVSRCIGCSSMGLPCLGRGCPNYEVPEYVCDKCGYEIDSDIYTDEEYEHLCEDCLLELHKA